MGDARPAGRRRRGHGGIAIVAVCVAAALGLAAPAGAQTQEEGVGFQPLFRFGNEAGPNKLDPFALDVAVDSDGNVWVVDSGHNRVNKYTYNGEFITSIGAPTITDPRGIGADTGGFVYVVDRGPVNHVVRLSNGGVPMGTFGASAPSAGTLSGPDDVAVGPDGTVYVSDGQVERFSAAGVALGPLGTVNAAGPIAVSDTGVVHTLDGGQVTRTDAAGAPVGMPIPLAPAFTGTPAGLATGPRGEFYVAFSGDGLVGRYGPDGGLIERIGHDAADQPYLVAPSGTALDCRRNLYVLDTYSTGSPPVNESAVEKIGDPNTKPPPCGPPPPPPSGPVDVQVNDVEVTQAIQPVRDTAGTLDLALHTRARTYGAGTGEVPLISGRKTIVRVYATLRTGPAGGLANVPATLEARPQPDASSVTSINPVAGPAVLQVGTNQVATAQRTNPAGAYTFVLPDAWTRSRSPITLTARVNPTGVGCDDDCRARSTFQLLSVRFQPSYTPSFAEVASPEGVTILPLALTRNGDYPSLGGRSLKTQGPQPAFAAAQAVTPVDLHVDGWAGAVEVGDITAQTVRIEKCFLGIELGILCSTDTLNDGDEGARDVLQGMLFDRIEDWINGQRVRNNRIVFGLISGGRGDLPGASRGKVGNGRVASNDAFGGAKSFARGYGDTAAPLKAISHEIGHMLGRPHASGCGGGGSNGQVAEPWPPDEKGFLEGLGLDPRANSGKGRGPFAMLAGDGGAFYDLMSYCAGDANSWISPKGWNEIVGFRAAGRAAAARGTRAAAGGVPVLRVNAIQVVDGRLAIASVSPETGAAPAADASAPYQVEARDANGAILASAPAAAEPIGHLGGIMVSGTVARPPATAQVVVRRGTEIATRVQRSPNAPTVRLSQPRARQRVRGATLAVRWTAGDKDGGTLGAVVDYSADGGRSFTTISSGPAGRGGAVLPVSALTPSRRARIRIRVDDGFSVATATSAPFRVDPVAPTVTITDPPAALRQRADAPLRLRGQATGARGAALRSTALRWFDGRRAIGRGASLYLRSLSPGRHRLRLVAAQAGRTGSATVSVTATAVTPAFLALSAPAKLSRSARTVRLRVASSIPAQLRVGGRRYAVGQVARTITVRVRPGSAPLKLGLRLAAGRLARVQTLTITRG